MAWDPQDFEAPLSVEPRDSRLHQLYIFIRRLLLDDFVADTTLHFVGGNT